MLRRCPDCEGYTLQDACPACGSETHDPAPPKFSPEDDHGVYRRRLKRLEEQERST